MAGVGVGEATALGLKDGVEAGDEHVGGDASQQRLVDPLKYLPRRRGVQGLRDRLSMPQVVDMTRAAGTPLPVASPTTSPSRPSERRWKS